MLLVKVAIAMLFFGPQVLCLTCARSVADDTSALPLVKGLINCLIFHDPII
jgi:hypothetical protein